MADHSVPPTAEQPRRARRALVTLAVATAVIGGGAGTAYAASNGPTSTNGPATAAASPATTDPSGTSVPAAPAPPAPPAGQAPAAPPAPGDTSAPKPAATKPKPHIDGTVSSISGDRITVTDPEGFSRQIAVSSTTVYRTGPAAPGSTSGSGTVSRSSITVGTSIHAEGAVATDRTTLDATVVELRTGPEAAGPPALPAPPAATTPSTTPSPVSGS